MRSLWLYLYPKSLKLVKNKNSEYYLGIENLSFPKFTKEQQKKFREDIDWLNREKKDAEKEEISKNAVLYQELIDFIRG